MTKQEAIQEFFSRFGLPVYSAQAIPDNVTLPYLTHDISTGAWGDGENSITVNLWFYTESEAIPDQKADELSRAFGLGGVVLPCDGGAVWLKRGSPWCQTIKDAEDDKIKGRYINVSAEYHTSY